MGCTTAAPNPRTFNHNPGTRCACSPSTLKLVSMHCARSQLPIRGVPKDMSPSELELGEVDTDEVFTYSPSARKIVTQAYDLSVQTLVEQWDNQTLILPEIQRQYLWDD